MEEFELSHIAGGNVKSYSFFRKQSGRSSKQLNRITGARNSTPSIHLRKHCQHKNLYKIVLSHCIWNILKLKTTKISLSKWIFKQTGVYSYHRIPFSNKKRRYIDTYNHLDWSQWYILSEKAKLKRPHSVWFRVYNTLEIIKLWW